MNDPIDAFTGTILVIAPHMDDEALACGGMIARLPDKSNIHLIYATDGMKSPPPIVPGRDRIPHDLGEIRMQESMTAMRHFGIPPENLIFLKLPEGELPKHINILSTKLLGIITKLNPNFIFIPFRYDRHPDHLVINHIVVNAFHTDRIRAQIVEYFVYYRSRLLPLKDIRKYIHPDHLIAVDIQDVASEKRAALNCFTSQITLYFPWQTRPILTSALLDEECVNPEYFIRYNRNYPGHTIFQSSVLWIRLAHRIEPPLKQWKYFIGSYLKRLVKNGP